MAAWDVLSEEPDDPWAILSEEPGFDVAAEEEPVTLPPPPGKGLDMGNINRGFAERGADILGNIAGFAETAGEHLEESEYGGLGGFAWLDEGYIPTYLDAKEWEAAKAEGGPKILRNFQKSLVDADFGYEEGTPWAEVKEAKGFFGTAAKLAPFALETGLVSVADMIGVVAALPAYYASRTEEIAQDRAANDGREGEPSKEDLAVGATTAAIVVAMEKFGAERVAASFVPGPDKALTRITKAAVGEGSTEFVQEQVEYAGETVGTQKPWNMAESLERGAQGLSGGVAAGTTVGTAGAITDAALGKFREPGAEPEVETDPLTPDFQIKTLEENATVINDLIEVIPDPPVDTGDVPEEPQGFQPVGPDLEEADAEIQDWAREALESRTGEVVGKLPEIGLVVAGIGADGKVYIGGKGELHAHLSGKYMEKIRKNAELDPGESTWKQSGYVGPDGKFLSREEALARVKAARPDFKESENVPGELDAGDFNDQVGMGVDLVPEEEPKGVTVEEAKKRAKAQKKPAKAAKTETPASPELDEIEAKLKDFPKDITDLPDEKFQELAKLMRGKRDLTDQLEHGLTPKQNRLERDRLMTELYEKGVSYGKYATISDMRELLGDKGTVPKKDKIKPAEVKDATEPVEPTGKAIEAAETFRAARPEFAKTIFSFKPGDDRNGEEMLHFYGEIAKTEDKDDMPIDVMLNKDYDPKADTPIFIVNQDDGTGVFQQHKVMAGFDEMAEAEEAYMDHWGEESLKDTHELTADEFQNWLDTGDHKVEYGPAAKEEGITPEAQADNWADVVKKDKNLSQISPETARLMSLAGELDHNAMVAIASKEILDTEVQAQLQALIDEKTGKTTTKTGSEAAGKTGRDDVKVKRKQAKKKPFKGETSEDIEDFPWQEYADHYDVELMAGKVSDLDLDARTYIIDVYSDKGRQDFVRRVYVSNYDQYRKVEQAYSDKYGDDTFIEVTKTAPEHDRDSMAGIIADQNTTEPYRKLRPIAETEDKITGGKVSKKSKLARGELLQQMGFLTKSQWDQVSSEYKHLLTAPESDKVVKTWGEEFKKTAKRDYISHAEGKKQIAEWKAHAKAIGKRGGNGSRVIMSLFDATGEWAQPWIDAGYDVRAIDLKRDDVDIRDIDYGWLLNYGFLEGEGLWGILAACPCQKFTNTTARDRKPGKERPGVKGGTDFIGDTHSAIDLVEDTLGFIEFMKPRFWALENPLGRIQDITSTPDGLLYFNPNNFGDPYTKKTVLHGHFNPNLPTANVDPRVEHGGEGSKIQTTLGSKDEINEGLRSVTPEGFAYAFFMANNDADYSIHEELAQDYIENFPKKGSFRGTPLEDQVRMGWMLGAQKGVSNTFMDDHGSHDLEDIGDLPIEVQAAIEDGRDYHNDEDGWKISNASMTVAEQAAMEQKLRAGIDTEPTAAEQAAFDKEVGDATPNRGTKKEKVALIACCKTKGDREAPARELYQGPLFKAQLEYAESLGADRILVLSAEHGPVELDQVIEPYDTGMKSKSADEKKNWARVAYNVITSKVNPNGSEFIFLAGKDYRTELSKLLGQHPDAKVDAPFEGMGIGEQQSELKRRNSLAEKDAGREQAAKDIAAQLEGPGIDFGGKGPKAVAVEPETEPKTPEEYYADLQERIKGEPKWRKLREAAWADEDFAKYLSADHINQEAAEHGWIAGYLYGKEQNLTLSASPSAGENIARELGLNIDFGMAHFIGQQSWRSRKPVDPVDSAPKTIDDVLSASRTVAGDHKPLDEIKLTADSGKKKITHTAAYWLNAVDDRIKAVNKMRGCA